MSLIHLRCLTLVARQLNLHDLGFLKTFGDGRHVSVFVLTLTTVQGSVATTPGREPETAVGTSGGKSTLPTGQDAHAASGNAGSTASQSVAGSDTAANQDTPRSAVSQGTTAGKTQHSTLTSKR